MGVDGRSHRSRWSRLHFTIRRERCPAAVGRIMPADSFARLHGTRRFFAISAGVPWAELGEAVDRLMAGARPRRPASARSDGRCRPRRGARLRVVIGFMPR